MRTPFPALFRSAFLTLTSVLPIAPLTLHAPTAHAQAAASLEGTWQGAVRQANGSDNRWVVKIEKAGAAWKGTMWFIDQKSPAIPIDKVSFDSGTLNLDIGRIGITYEGKMTADGNSISGTRTAGDNKAPLVFLRATPATAWEIPEPPPPPKKIDPKAEPAFETATIKPQPPDQQAFAYLLNPAGNFTGRGLTVEKLMTISMTLNSAQIVGLPDWAKQEKYDIEGKTDTPGVPTLKQFFGEVTKLLGERFGLKYHIEKRTMTAYSLSVTKSGIKMQAPLAGSGDIPGYGMPAGRMNVSNTTMAEFCAFLQSNVLDHPVVDQTGLGGTRYSGNLKYQMDDAQAMKMGLQKVPPPPETGDVPPPLITALAEQFGLKLESGKIPVDVIVVDSVSKPTPN